MVKKVPHVLNTEDLLRVIESSHKEEPEKEVPEILEYTNDILPFLSKFNIIPGDKMIKKNLLFSIYKAWSKNPKKKKEFILEMNKYFRVRSPDGSNYFYINKNAMSLTHEIYQKYKKHNKKVTSRHWVQHFEDFLNYHALESKNYWIHINILYFLYEKYLHERKLNTSPSAILNKHNFESFCNLYLQKKITKDGPVYAVSSNIEAFFQPGQLERMRKTYAKKEDDKEKKVKKRRTRKTRFRS